MGLQLTVIKDSKGEHVRLSILRILHAHPGQWVSGSTLGRELGISRAAVSKHMRLLKEVGYPVEAVTRHGYRLGGDADTLRDEAVRYGLRTACFGQGRVVYFASTPSTNMEARVLAEQGAAEGTVVLAEQQTAGRGRQGRTWHSPAGGGVYMSVLLRPGCTLQNVPVLTLLTAAAVTEAVRKMTGLPAVAKWPNDVLIHQRKVCGVLVEAGVVADMLDYAVLGVGINVSADSSKLGLEVPDTAISLCEAVTGEHMAGVAEQAPEGWRIPRAPVARHVLEALEEWYTLFCTQGESAVVSRWKSCSHIVGHHIRLGRGDAVITGQVLDVDDSGRLLLKDEGGCVHQLPVGDVLET